MKIICINFQRVIVYIFYIFYSFVFAQPYIFQGYLSDAETNLPVRQSTILLKETGEKKISDENGRFQFAIHVEGHYTLSIHHVAYLNVDKAVFINSNDTLSIQLQPTVVQSNDVIVYSTRSILSAESSPFPVSVELHDRLLQNQVMTISDELKKSPGVSIVRDGAWETGISIRGMSRSNIVKLIDNTRIETANDIGGALSLININDLERIETVRSPGAALYGTGALGGVVHLVTKQPSFTEQFQLRGEINSSFSSVNNSVSHYAAVEGTDERSALRISGGYRNAQNIQTPIGVLPNSQFSDFSINSSLNVKTYNDHSLHLSYQRSQAENAGITGGSPIAQTAIASYKLIKRELFSSEYVFPNLTNTISSLSAKLAFQNITRNVEILQNSSLTLTPHAIHTTVSAQIESKITVTENNFVIIGVEGWQRSLNSKRERIKKDTIIGELPVPKSKFFSTGVYGQDTWDIFPEQLSVILGARYDWIFVSNEEANNPDYIIANGILNPSPLTQKLFWAKSSTENNSWSANLGFQLALSKEIDANVLASTAFRSPSLEERYQFVDLGNVVRLGNPYLKPEQSKGINTGIVFHADGTLLHADCFINYLTNMVVDIPGFYEGGTAFIKQNIGKAKLYGYEISVRHSISSWAAANYSISYVRGEDTYGHANLPQIAPFHGTIELTARLPEIAHLTLTSSFSSNQENFAYGETRTAGYGIFDINVVTNPIVAGQLFMTLRSGVQNVFNREYRNHISTLRGAINVEPGRNIFLAIAIKV